MLSNFTRINQFQICLKIKKTKKRDLNKERSKKEIFSDATHLDQRLTVPMLSETSAYKSQRISKYSRESFVPLEGYSTIRFSY